MKNEITEKIIAFFEENTDVFNAAVEELDSYNGYLTDDRYYPMECLEEFYSGKDIIYILNRAFFGYDEDNYITDQHGNREHAAFNPNRDYFKYNGYGNLVSTDYIDYSQFLDHYIVQEFLDNRDYIDAIIDNEELTRLFDELEKAEEQEDN